MISTDPIHNIENLTARNKTKSISIYLVVVIAMITVVCLLPVIMFDISSQSRGIIRSTTDNVPVTTLASGRITWMALHNNAMVHKGDTIIKIAKDGLIAEKKTQDTLSNTIALQLQDVSRLLQGNTNSLKTAAAREDYNKYSAQKNEWQIKIQQAQLDYNRNKGLFDKNVISRVEYEKYAFALRNANQGLQSFTNQQKANWQTQKTTLEERLKNIHGNVAKIKVQENDYVVLAPITGTIENFMGLQVGSLINASQAIATISPVDNLIVESTVSPNDIGLLKKNQTVKFQLDAFNYNQWGLLEGKVIDIDKNITQQENQAFFKVRCSLKSKTLSLKSGYKTQISKGMTLTARYTITRRSLFDLLFDKVDDWINPKLETRS
jgi:membrane fusion protein, peptide pheromone/bacteriocin exporter